MENVISELSASLSPPYDPSHPPTRIYLGGLTYKLVAPRVALPPLVGTIKTILNWVGPASQVAKTILHIITPGGTDTSNPANLLAAADLVHSAFSSSGIQNSMAATWQMNNVTAHDNGAPTGAQNVSVNAPVVGAASGLTLPPGVAICWSWQIGYAYRGGKPRSYMPAVPENALTTAGASQILSSYALGLAGQVNNFRAQVNAASFPGGPVTLGSISYFTGHALRPVPQFRPFHGVEVHERLDSQRRRNGKESSFGEAP